jgi:hypothetical protein
MDYSKLCSAGEVIDGDKGTDWVLPEEMVPAKAVSESFSRSSSTLPIQNQGVTNTCVGQTAKICMQDSDDYRNEDELSPMYVYYWAQRMDEWAGEAYQGTSNSGACKAMRNKGMALNKVWKNGVDAPPLAIEKHDELAAGRKLKNYYKVEVQDLKFEEKIKALLHKEPLLCSYRVAESFFSTGKDGVVNKDAWEKTYDASRNLGHDTAMTGYRVIDGELYWELQNSWGEGWGDGGFCYMPNSILKKYALGGVYYLVTQSENQEATEFEFEKKSKKTMFKVVGGIGGGLLLFWLLSLL